MNDFDQHHRLAFLVSAILTLVLLIAGGIYLLQSGLAQTFWQTRFGIPTQEQNYNPTPQELQAITDWYVRSLSVYDQARQPAIERRASEAKPDGQTWLHFRLQEEARNIDITLRVQGWHVLGHAVTITTKDGRLALMSPEPGQIAAVSVPLFVNGRAAGETTVTLRLLDSTSGVVLNQQIVPTTNGEFSHAFELTGITTSELTLQAQAGESTLDIPFSLDIYGR